MKFYSHGKLLISGEYLVLKGAAALATPLKFGQSLKVLENKTTEGLLWESFVQNKVWFSATYTGDLFDIAKTTDRDKATRLANYLHEAKKLNPYFLEETNNLHVKTIVDFDINWGLGSSSSLLSNIAYWANVDQFVLNRNVSLGSGYDVICARQKSPVIFELTGETYSLEKVEFNPSFKENIYFIFLGRKQDSAESVIRFNLNNKSFKNEIQLVSDLSRHIAFSKELNDFEYYLKEHEKILSTVLKIPGIKEKRFANFDGEVKSLGAWGGDFAMITWQGTKNELKKYLKTRDIEVLFTFDQIVRT